MCSTILKFYPGWTQEESHLSAPDVTRYSKSEVFWKHTLVEHRKKAICLHLMWQGINNPRGIEKTHYRGEHMRNAICLHYMWQGIQIQGVLRKHTGRTQEKTICLHQVWQGIQNPRSFDKTHWVNTVGKPFGCRICDKAFKIRGILETQ